MNELEVVEDAARGDNLPLLPSPRCSTRGAWTNSRTHATAYEITATVVNEAVAPN